MTIPEFVAEVKALGLEWRYTKLGEIRCSLGDCPIIALARDKKLLPENLLNNSYAGTASRALRLGIVDSCKIVYAADGFGYMGDRDTRRLLEKELLPPEPCHNPRCIDAACSIHFPRK